MSRFARRAKRPARYTAPLTCQVVRERDFRLVADRILNLSPGGALVGPADPVLTGERLLLSFCVGHGIYVDAEVVVARVVHGRRAGEHTRYLGLSFESLDEPSLAVLHRYLRSAVPVPPGARNERRAQPRPLAPRGVETRRSARAHALDRLGDDFAVHEGSTGLQVLHGDAGGLAIVRGGADLFDDGRERGDDFVFAE